MRKHREKFRTMSQKGVPYDAVYLHKHYFNNNNPLVWVVFVVKKYHLQQQEIESVKLFSDRTHNAMSRSQVSMVNTGMENMKKLHLQKSHPKHGFAKH